MSSQVVIAQLLGALVLTSAAVQGPPTEPPTTNVALCQPFCIPGTLGTLPWPCGNPPAAGGLGCDNFSPDPAASGTLFAFGSASAGAISRPGLGDPGVSARSAILGDTIPLGSARHDFDTYRDPAAAGPAGTRRARSIRRTP